MSSGPSSAQQEEAIERLKQRCPTLSSADARRFLEENEWNVGRSWRAVNERNGVPPPHSASANPANHYFVGGGDHGSGQQVVAPSSGPPRGVRDVVDSVFEKARKEGASEADDDFGGDQRAFYGRGQRLGYTTNPSPYVASTLRPHRSLVVRLYRNGVQVEDDPLIPLESPEGKAFVESLDRGYVPAAIAAKYPNTDVSVQLKDLMSEDYETPSHVAFQGTGHRLSEVPSSPGPAGSSSVAKAPASSAGATSGLSYDPARQFELSEGEEASSTIRLTNTRGEQKEVKVNPGKHTVEDVYYLAHTFQPEVPRFILVVRDVPPRRLDDSTRALTVEAAKLKRAVVSMQALP